MGYSKNSKLSVDDQWARSANKLLKGLTIQGVRYMSTEEAEDMGWVSRPVVILLNNGLQIYPSADDEGNDGGALFTTDSKEDVLPVLR